MVGFFTRLSVLKLELRLLSIEALECASRRLRYLPEQFRESHIIRITGRRLAIGQNPIGILREERIMNLALERGVAGNFSRESWRMF